MPGKSHWLLWPCGRKQIELHVWCLFSVSALWLIWAISILPCACISYFEKHTLLLPLLLLLTFPGWFSMGRSFTQITCNFYSLKIFWPTSLWLIFSQDNLFPKKCPSVPTIDPPTLALSTSIIKQLTALKQGCWLPDVLLMGFAKLLQQTETGIAEVLSWEKLAKLIAELSWTWHVVDRNRNRYGEGSPLSDLVIMLNE